MFSSVSRDTQVGLLFGAINPITCVTQLTIRDAVLIQNQMWPFAPDPARGAAVASHPTVLALCWW